MEDRRSALSAWILVNVHRDTDQRRDPFSLEEVVAWLCHGFQQGPRPAPAAAPATPEELKQRIGIVHTLHQGLYGENGSGQG